MESGSPSCLARRLARDDVRERVEECSSRRACQRYGREVPICTSVLLSCRYRQSAALCHACGMYGRERRSAGSGCPEPAAKTDPQVRGTRRVCMLLWLLLYSSLLHVYNQIAERLLRSPILLNACVLRIPGHIIVVRRFAAIQASPTRPHGRCVKLNLYYVIQARPYA